MAKTYQGYKIEKKGILLANKIVTINVKYKNLCAGIQGNQKFTK